MDKLSPKFVLTIGSQLTWIINNKVESNLDIPVTNELLRASVGRTNVKRTRRRIDSALKVEIVFEALRGQKSVADLAEQYGLHPNQIYAWQKQLKNYAAFAFDLQTRHIAELKAKIRPDP